MSAPAPRTRHVVAVDGPAAAGKTTASLVLAKKYRLEYLESGQAYRLMAYLALRDGIQPDEEDAILRLYRSIFGSSGKKQVIIEGANYGRVLREPEVTRAVSKVSSIPMLRAEITEAIRSWSDNQASIVEGRDIGTTVFPAATVKFYLTAEADVRARRRLADEVGRTYQNVLADVIRRDQADITRSASPLRPAQDSIVIDTSRMTIGQVVSKMSQECLRAGLIPAQLNVTAHIH